MVIEETLAERTPKAAHIQWHILPDALHPQRFQLIGPEGEVLCTLFVHRPNPGLLTRIACTPELEDIAEMFRDHMLGGPMQHTMLFTLVQTVLNRLKPMTEQKLTK